MDELELTNLDPCTNCAGKAQQCQECTQIDRVQPEDACPICGERRVDWLGLNSETGIVECQVCGAIYHV